MKVHDDIASSIDKKGIAVLLLIDFAKAFDRVSHRKLLNKLGALFGFSRPAVKLIETYLTNRYQSVFFNSQFSSLRPIDSGVPQGSILGPLLFSLFINDLPSALKFCSVHMFADDVQIYFCADSRTSTMEMSRLINYDLQQVFQWSQENLLPINTTKTKAVFINRHRRSHFSMPELIMNNEQIQFADQVNNLGVIFNSKLDWEPQINSQVGKIYGILKQLSLTTNHLSYQMKIKLFKSLIYPHFIYNDFIYLNATANSLNKLASCCTQFLHSICF